MLYRVLSLERPSLPLLRGQDVALRALKPLGKYQVLGTSTPSWGCCLAAGSSDSLHAGNIGRVIPSLSHVERHVNTDNSVCSFTEAIIQISGPRQVTNWLERNERNYVAN